MESVPRLCASDKPRDTTTLDGKRLRLFEDVLDELRGLAGSGATLEDDDLGSVHGVDDLLAIAVDGQRLPFLLHDR